MPTMAEGLSQESSDAQTKAAISDCIAQQMHEHPDMDVKQATAICYSMARKSTGKTLGGGAE